MDLAFASLPGALDGPIYKPVEEKGGPGRAGTREGDAAGPAARLGHAPDRSHDLHGCRARHVRRLKETTMAPRTYIPHGTVVKLLAAMKAEPQREFSSHEAAKIMGCHLFSVTARIQPAVRERMMFRRSFGRGRPAILRGSPFPPGTAGAQACQRSREGEVGVSWITRQDDLRVPKVVPGWVPAPMRHVRGGA